MEQVSNLIRARAKCIWINTFEEEFAIDDIREVSLRLKQPMNVYSYSFATGIQSLELFNNAVNKVIPIPINSLLKNIYNITNNIEIPLEEREEILEEGGFALDSSNNIFILKDFHLMINTPEIKRYIRDIFERSLINYNCIIVISPFTEIPSELEKLFTVINYDTPDEKIIEEILDNALSLNPKMINTENITPETKTKIIKNCKGLTFNEITYILKLSIIKHKAIVLDEIMNYKIDIIKKTNILEYKVPNFNIEDIGGNNEFKKWTNEVVASMSEEALKFGCEKPKGYLALGIPGCAKTVMAEALATKMGVTFLKLDMSKIMDSRVGNSEKNIATAMRMVKATAPCVLLIDEVEKSLSGLGSSNNSDSGTLSRVFGAVLEFLAEDHGVFVVMTSNDVSQLPPELTRAGRLDSIWYFGIPDEEERKEIFDIHFKKIKNNIDKEIIEYAASISSNFTGAEIKEMVKCTIRKAFNRYLKDKNDNILKKDVLEASLEIIPVYKSSKEKILLLESYAKGRAKYSNKQVESKINKPNKNGMNGLFNIGELR